MNRRKFLTTIPAFILGLFLSKKAKSKHCFLCSPQNKWEATHKEAVICIHWDGYERAVQNGKMKSSQDYHLAYYRLARNDELVVITPISNEYVLGKKRCCCCGYPNKL